MVQENNFQNLLKVPQTRKMKINTPLLYFFKLIIHKYTKN